MGSDSGGLLSKAGFTIEAERTFDIVLYPPLPAAAAATPGRPCGASGPASTAG